MTALANLPEWNLNDLYVAPDAPALKADIEKSEADCKSFAASYQGKLASLSGDQLAASLKAYESLSDLIGRIGSYAQLYYVGDTTDSVRAKFYGDTSATLTELSTLLLFYELEFNMLDDDHLAVAMTSPALAHYKPWIDNLRMEKPFQLDAKLEQLFLEKSQTGAGAFNRLFDETMAALTFEVDRKSVV